MLNETMAVIYYTMYYFVLIHQKVHIVINLYILHSILFIHFIFWKCIVVNYLQDYQTVNNIKLVRVNVINKYLNVNQLKWV